MGTAATCMPTHMGRMLGAGRCTNRPLCQRHASLSLDARHCLPSCTGPAAWQRRRLGVWGTTVPPGTFPAAHAMSNTPTCRRDAHIVFLSHSVEPVCDMGRDPSAVYVRAW